MPENPRRTFAGWEVTLIAATLAAGVLHAAAAPPHFPTADPPTPSAHPRTTQPPPPSTVEPAPPAREPALPARARPTPGAQVPPPAVPTHPAEEDGRLLGWAFLLAAAFAGWAVWQLASRPRGRLFLAAVAAGHGLMVAAGLASRTVGFLGHKDPWWEVAFLLALACELVVVATVTPRALRPAGAQPTRGGGVRMKQKLSKHWRRAKLFGWATLVTGMLAANALVGPLAPAKWRWVPL